MLNNYQPFLQSAFNAIQNFIFPHTCLICKKHLHALSGLCHSCATDLRYIQNNYCQICGYPFELNIGHEISCGQCLKKAPTYEKARAIFYYDTLIKNLILKLKHGDMHYVVPFLSQQMHIYIQKYALEADYIIPVPAHFRRLWFRMYNQTSLLAHEIKKNNHFPVLMQGLKRVKHTTQKNASREKRSEHLKSAFICPPNIQKIIANKRILLIDDVMTSGATVNACAETLMRAGANKVQILTLARVTFQTHHQLKIDF